MDEENINHKDELKNLVDKINKINADIKNDYNNKKGELKDLSLKIDNSVKELEQVLFDLNIIDKDFEKKLDNIVLEEAENLSSYDNEINKILRED